MADRDDTETTKGEDEQSSTRGEFERWDTEPDPEEAALAKAKALVEAEERGENPGEEQPAEASDDETAEADKSTEGAGKSEDKGEQKGQEPSSIPYARFKQVNDQLSATQKALDYMRQAMEARSNSSQGKTHEASKPTEPDQTGTKPQASGEQLIEQAYSLIDDASQQYDRGEISMTEFKRIERQAEDQIWQVRQATMQPASPQETAGDQWVMDQHAADLEAKNPWLNIFDVNDLQRLARIAKESFDREGHPLGEGPRETMRLREKVSELTHTYGPAWYPDDASSVYQQQPGSQQPKRQESQQAKDGRRALDTAADFPPDTQQTGRVGESSAITEADIDKMTEEEIMALPASERHRLMGIA